MEVTALMVKGEEAKGVKAQQVKPVVKACNLPALVVPAGKGIGSKHSSSLVSWTGRNIHIQTDSQTDHRHTCSQTLPSSCIRLIL